MKNLIKEKGPIAWMTQNLVAANLLMIIFIVGGIVMTTQVKQEVFPEFDLDIIQIRVPYPGASPSEVEQGIILAIEEEVRGLDGVKRVTSTATEGMGIVSVELVIGTNENKALQDIKNGVDRIVSFPQEAERPIVSLLTTRREVISLIVYGEMQDRTLRQLAEQVRDELLQKDDITLVELSGVRPLEISVEVPHEQLRRYNLTLDGIANEIRRTSVELSGGEVETEGGDVLLRTMERRDYGQEFGKIPVVSQPDGSFVQLEDIATIVDGFRDTDQSSYFFGKPAIKIVVYRIGDQTPIEVAQVVKEYAEDLELRLPDGIGVATWQDWSEIYYDRINLLLRNAGLGLALVLFILGIFLEIRLAFWVTMGIPISFLGAILFLPAMEVSINMISLFAFIVTLGIVVDDAIVVGENIFEKKEKGFPPIKGAIEGARQVAVPVTFAIMTNITAFTPMFFVPGVSGKIFGIIPIIVILVFLISLIESLFILPAHLGHLKEPKKTGLRGFIYRQQNKFSRFLTWFIKTFYQPLVRTSIHFRYLTISIGLVVLLTTIGYVVGGHINFSYMPRVDSDLVTASLELPYGTPVEDTRKIMNFLIKTAQETLDNHGGEKITRGLLSQIGSHPRTGAFEQAGIGGGGHLANVQVFMVSSDKRDITAVEFTNEWRKRVGEITGVESLVFQYSIGPSGGDPINIELSHPNVDILEQAGEEVAEALATYSGVIDIDDGFSQGKEQLDFKIKPEAQGQGFTVWDIARQVRGAFYGSEALRQQRGRNEVRVMVRLPENERQSEYNVEELLIRGPQGKEIPLMEAATVERGHSYTEINRAEGRRVINVTADVVEGVANATKVLEEMEQETLPEILQKYPGMTFTFEGEQKSQQEAVSSLLRGFILAMLVIFAMLAIPFRSYVQPLIIMTLIPFGIVGAVIGHLIMGYEISIISLMGIVALTGVVVNDSLVLIHTANENKLTHKNAFESVANAAVRRFRPILLTSLTTFFGLAPMIFETSVQARFLIPMAISLGYGILFATLIVLFLVPCMYLIIDDLKWLLGIRETLDDIIDKHKEENQPTGKSQQEAPTPA